ncbi:putative RNA polymerase II subunit B1 CTD phosphatase Rpap2 [Liolophura sinensis]|uniref:putative RNA polymerase II subunit B1 CTD phosphatase Rpap2 n=1 Tax=Liolophura sinensis TaxID=3198878 RepID=UPI00315963E5
MSEASGDSNDSEVARKAELEAKIRKRVAYEERAFRIVEKLLDNTVTSEYLADCGLYITPSHYADIVEERAIINTCGYPVCSNVLGAIPQQKYFISTKSNRVYDVTERKNFCSNKCFKASKYFEKQISTTPVWLREEEKPVELKVLDPTQNLGSPGFEVVGVGVKSSLLKELSVLEKLDSTEDQSEKGQKQSTNEPEVDGSTSARLSSSITAKSSPEHVTSTKSAGVTDVSLDVSGGTRVTEGLGGNTKIENSMVNTVKKSSEGLAEVDTLATSLSDKLNINPWSENFEGSNKACSVKKKAPDESSPKHEERQGVAIGGASSKTDYLMQLLSRRKKLLSSMIDDQPTQSLGQKNSSTEIKPHPAKCEESLEIKEKSVTFDSNESLEPENRNNLNIQTRGVMANFASSPVISTEVPESKRDFEKQCPGMHPQLVQIYCKVFEWVSNDTLKYLGVAHSPEMEDSLGRRAEKKGASEETNQLESFGMDSGKGKNNDGKQLENKLSQNASVSGRLPEKDREFTQKVLQFYKGTSKRATTAEDTEHPVVEPILPPVDSIAQTRIRRKIVLEKLERSMPEMLAPLGLVIQHISSELRELVSTFSLTSTNITFKPGEWTLVALLLVKMLSQKIPQIQKSFEDGRSLHFYYVFLANLGCSLDELDKILHILLKTKPRDIEAKAQAYT